MENSNDTIGDRTATFRLVAQGLDQLRHQQRAAEIYYIVL